MNHFDGGASEEQAEYAAAARKDERVEAMVHIIVRSALWGWDAAHAAATRSEVRNVATATAERLVKQNKADPC